jgi:hypothetical protein
MSTRLCESDGPSADRRVVMGIPESRPDTWEPDVHQGLETTRAPIPGTPGISRGIPGSQVYPDLGYARVPGALGTPIDLGSYVRPGISQSGGERGGSGKGGR